MKPYKDKARSTSDVAFNEGKEAAIQGLSVGMCPYSGWQQLTERKNWLYGFECIKKLMNREAKQ